MHMRMVVVTGRRRLASPPIGVGRRNVVGVVVTMFVAVVTEMAGITLRMFQRVTNTHDRRGGGIQRKQDGKKEGQAGAHGGRLYQQSWLFVGTVYIFV